MRMLLLLLLILSLQMGKKQHSPYLIVSLFPLRSSPVKVLIISCKYTLNMSNGTTPQVQASQVSSWVQINLHNPHQLIFSQLSMVTSYSIVFVSQIDRKEIQSLLHVCFEAQQNGGAKHPQYFIYEKYEYYIINLDSGQAMDMESYLKTHANADKQAIAVLKVSKKYLKQLRADLTIAWSAISSQLNLLPISLFLQDPKSQTSNNSLKIQQSGLKFRRVGKHDIEMISQDGSFQMGGSSHIIAIFSYLNSQLGIINHPLPLYTPTTLALQHKPQPSQFKQLTQFGKIRNTAFNFPHSKNIKKSNQRGYLSQLEFCINTFRSMQAITDDSNNIKSQLHFHFHKHDSNQSMNLPSIQHLSNYSPPVLTYGPTDDQPYIWIALMLAVLSTFFWIYKMHINFLLSELSSMENQTDLKLSEFQKRLGQVEQLKKMYEVYWEKQVYHATGDQWYQHFVFQGKFLNQQTFVYAVRLEGTDVISLEHKLNLMLNFSNKGIAKLYYYTRNIEFLLIFTQKFVPLSLKDIQVLLNVQISNSQKKAVINGLLESVAYLDSKIQVDYLPLEAVSIEPIIQNQPEPYYAFKISAVPCFLRRSVNQNQKENSIKEQADKQNSSCLESDTWDLRLNLVGLFHLIIHRGVPLNKQQIDQLLRNQAYSQQQYLQFFDFVLYQVQSRTAPADREKDIQNTATNENSRQLMFRYILDHPFLWDSKRKILFLSDFSNYIETHIDEAKVRKLQSHARDYNVIKIPWIKQFHPMFVKEVSNYRKYDYESVRDLFRVIRNKLNHYHEIPKQVRALVGKTPDDFIQYCLELFPKLLHFAFVYSHKKKWKLHMK